MADEWRWDETLYRGSAAYYGVGRMPYPPKVADALARALGLDGTQRLLDVGCGPGSLTLLVAARVAVAVGIDADPDMIAAASAAAARAGVRNVEWRHMRAEELPGDLGRFAVATFAQSMHWLDRPMVMTTVRGMLEPGGAVVHVQATPHEDRAGHCSRRHPQRRRDHGRNLLAVGIDAPPVRLDVWRS